MGNTITVERFPDIVDDKGICDVARVSFDKRAENYSDEANAKLIKYLTSHGHWSPPGQARFTLRGKCSPAVFIEFVGSAKLAGFKFKYNPVSEELTLNGSVWAFAENRNAIPLEFYVTSVRHLNSQFPWFYEAYFGKSHTGLKSDLKSPARVITRPELNDPSLIHASVRCTAPIYVVRQLGKHQVGLTWNEVSRRYVDSDPEHYDVTGWRKRPEGSIKQGSGGNVDEDTSRHINKLVSQLRKDSDSTYKYMLNHVAPEMARSILLQDMQTSWIWTGALTDFKRICRERMTLDAQQESGIFAKQLDNILEEEFGSLWTGLR